MFEHHREKKAQEQYQAALAQWQTQRDSTAHLLELAQTFPGESSSEIMLKADEGVFAKVTGASLVEERRGAGHYTGHSSGVSIPVGSLGGHQVRYRVGATRGHFVQGDPVPTSIDTGTLYVTNQRVIFQGGRQTRECLFAKLVGFQHDPAGSTTFSVSNRQKPTTVHYGTKVAGWVDFRLDLALAHYRSTLPALVARLQADLAQYAQTEPVAPVVAG